MKKLLAIIMAALLLASVAVAETANTMSLSNPSLELVDNGKTRQVNLSGMTVKLAAGMPGGVPTVQLDVTRKGKKVESSVAQFIDGKAYLQLDGISHVLCMDMNAGGVSGQRLVDAVFSDIDYLMDFKLPAFRGISIPKVDLIPLTAFIGAQIQTDEAGNQVSTFEIPYAMVKQLLTTLMQYRNSVPATAAPLLDAVDRMMKSDSGFALRGKVTDDGATAHLNLDVMTVENGVTSEVVAGTVRLDLAQNRIDLGVDVNQGITINLLNLVVEAYPEQAGLNVSMDAMGMLTFAGSLYPSGDAQVAALELNSFGKKISASMTYGPRENGEFINFALDIPNQLNVGADVQATYDGNGGSAGTLILGASTYGEKPVEYSLTGDVAEATEDVEFRSVKGADKAVDLLHMTGDQSKQLQKELNKLLEKFSKKIK